MRQLALILFIAASVSGQTPTGYTPLTSSERWEHYVHKTFLSPGLYFASLGEAGGLQLSKDPPEWGKGFTGYEKRAVTVYATYAFQYTVQDATAAAFGYDPRYIHCDCKGTGRRLAHVVLWSFLTKNNEGNTRFNAPFIAGAYAGGMLPYLWYPGRYSPFKDGLRDGNQELGITVGTNLFREFAPELRRFFGFRSAP
jgi:hypothetical protein